MANKRKDGPHWVKAWIADLSMLTDSFRDMNTGAVNFEALGKEEYLFRMALSRKDFSLSNRAKKVWEEAVGPYNQRITAANKKSPQDAPNGNAGVDMYDAGNGAASKSPTSCDQFTADGDTREDSQAKPDGSAITRNETRAHDALEPSANNSEARESQALESQRRTGGHSLRVGNVARPPVRSGRNSRCPNSREEFHAFVADNNLHEGLAEEWYAMHEAREWVDRDGKPIKDWRGALYNYCTKTEQKRRTA